MTTASLDWCSPEMIITEIELIDVWGCAARRHRQDQLVSQQWTRLRFPAEDAFFQNC